MDGGFHAYGEGCLMEKLFLVVRGDLSPGQQAVQAVHAMVAFASKWPNIAKHWETTSNHLVLLSVSKKEHLQELLKKAETKGLHTVSFEDDVGEVVEMTAIALEPKAKRLCQNLPLALAQASRPG